MTNSKVMQQQLIQYAQQYETADFLNGDPSWFMHQVAEQRDQETIAFLAAALSYGQRKQFMPKIEKMLYWSDNKPYDWVRNGGYKDFFFENDKYSFYRLYTNHHMYCFLARLQQLYKEYGSLGEYIQTQATTGIEAVEAICNYFAPIKTPIIPKDTTSACKRLCMFLRWMVRDDSPVDLGLWSHFIDKRTLIIPIDTHVLTEATRLQLINSRTATMATAQKLTRTLAEIFPDDPLRGDFALFGYGVNKNSNGK